MDLSELTSPKRDERRLPGARRRSTRDVWLIAWILTLALHGAGMLGLRRMAPLNPPAPSRPQPIRLVFKSPTAGTTTRSSERPQIFSELPPNRADAAPKKADFLSNVTSRARDRAPGGDDGAMPRMQGETDAPLVKMTADGGAPPATTPPSPAPQPTSPATPPAAPSPQRAAVPLRDGTAGSGFTVPQPPQPASGIAGAGGSEDMNQPEMANPDGNASLTGDVSLNTTAWDYAPWLQRFGRELMRRWIPPPAYSYGILKEGGWALIEVEISKPGKMLRLQLLEEKGHPSLSQAAQAALHSLSPIEPLPADFPEPTLILRIRMIYPSIRPRPDDDRPSRSPHR